MFWKRCFRHGEKVWVHENKFDVSARNPLVPTRRRPTLRVQECSPRFTKHFFWRTKVFKWAFAFVLLTIKVLVKLPVWAEGSWLRNYRLFRVHHHHKLFWNMFSVNGVVQWSHSQNQNCCDRKFPARSQVTSWFDNDSTNYCNLRNLYCNKTNGCVPQNGKEGNLNFTETVFNCRSQDPVDCNTITPPKPPAKPTPASNASSNSSEAVAGAAISEGIPPPDDSAVVQETAWASFIL